MRLFNVLSCGALLGASVMLAAPASADVPWSNPTGDQTDFTWNSGQSTDNLYGSPTNSGHDFIFDPSGFVVNDQLTNGQLQLDSVQIQAVPLNGHSISDAFSVNIDVKSGFRLFGVSLHEGGAFASIGGTVDATGTLSVTDLTPPGPANSDDLHTTPIFPASDDNGNWTGVASLIGDWTSVRIDVDTTLTAQGALAPSFTILEDGPVFSFNQISLDNAKLTLDIRPTGGPTPIPLPSALMLFPVGALAAWYCTKRFALA